MISNGFITQKRYKPTFQRLLMLLGLKMLENIILTTNNIINNVKIFPTDHALSLLLLSNLTNARS